MHFPVLKVSENYIFLIVEIGNSMSADKINHTQGNKLDLNHDSEEAINDSSMFNRSSSNRLENSNQNKRF